MFCAYYNTYNVLWYNMHMCIYKGKEKWTKTFLFRFFCWRVKCVLMKLSVQGKTKCNIIKCYVVKSAIPNCQYDYLALQDFSNMLFSYVNIKVFLETQIFILLFCDCAHFPSVSFVLPVPLKESVATNLRTPYHPLSSAKLVVVAHLRVQWSHDRGATGICQGNFSPSTPLSPSPSLQPPSPPSPPAPPHGAPPGRPPPREEEEGEITPCYKGILCFWLAEWLLIPPNCARTTDL